MTEVLLPFPFFRFKSWGYRGRWLPWGTVELGGAAGFSVQVCLTAEPLLLMAKWLCWYSLFSTSAPAMRETWVLSLGWEDPLEKEMATHSSSVLTGNPMDRGAWWATVHGVAKSWTWLSDFTSLPLVLESQQGSSIVYLIEQSITFLVYFNLSESSSSWGEIWIPGLQ